MSTRAAPTAARTPEALVDVTLAALSIPPMSTVTVPQRPGVTAAWPRWVDPRVQDALVSRGVTDLWRHQVEAADALWAGRDVVLSTGTASGKSLAYWLPALTAAVSDGGTTIYCTPTKALAADQRARLAELGLPSVHPATYDGDTDQDIRTHLRRTSRFILTNPDMLHRSVLPQHSRWRSYLSKLRFVVLDEGHMYRGIFGANVAAIVTRLRRLARMSGADPVFMVCSATLGNPQEAGGHLLGVPPETITAVTQDCAARGARTVILHDPAHEDDAAPVDPGDRPSAPTSAFADTAAALAAWVDAGIQSVGFVRSRAGVEAMAQTVRTLSETPAGAITAYRGGLLPEERRSIEAGLRSGDLRCVASTNALELGVDVAGLDAVGMCGWPGTRLSFLQQLGRAGRTGSHAVALLVAQQNPLDRYYAGHPERIFDTSLEATVLDPGNPYVLLGHVACAVSEQPLTTEQATSLFGPAAGTVLAVLERRGMIRLRGDTWFWVDRRHAASLADLRGAGQPLTIIESDTGRVMGTMDASSATSQLHPGAVYTHLGVTHLVESLDLEAAVAVVNRSRPGYTTVAQSVSDLRILTEQDTRPLGTATLSLGEVEVTSRVVGFLRRDAATGRVLGSEPLAMPDTSLRTVAAWWSMTDAAVTAAGLDPRRVPGAAHAAEHAAIGVLPALATCDRWDIGGLSTDCHPDTGRMTVFVYDGHPGGAGFAQRGFRTAEEWVSATASVIDTCDCRSGCPGCVQSPKCGNGNEPLDKAGATALLSALSTPSAPIG